MKLLACIGTVAAALLPLEAPGAPAVLFTEGFNSASCPPGWATEAVVGTAATITFLEGNYNPWAWPYEGTRFVSFSGGLPGCQARLKQTSSFSTVPCGPVTIDFAWFQNTNSFSQTGEGVKVQWSTNGTSWSDGDFYRHYNSVSNGWRRVQYSLPPPALGSATVWIAFLYRTLGGLNCYLDDLRVYALDGIANVTPATGRLEGANTVAISGGGMSHGDVTNVTICGIPATVLADNSPTQIVVSAGSAAVFTNGHIVVSSTSCGSFVKSNAYAYLPLGTYCADALSGSDTLGDGSSTNPWRTISYAVSNIFEPNAVLFVARGAYTGSVVVPISCAGLRLIGAGADTTKIQASGNNSGAIQLPPGAGYLVRGFTITGGYYLGGTNYRGGGVRGAGRDNATSTTAATIEENNISYNVLYGYFSTGGGISLGSNSVVRRNNFLSNYAKYGSGAVYVGPDSVIEDNLFEDNYSTDSFGGAIASPSTNVLILRNAFKNNRGSTGASGRGGAIYGQGIVRNNIFIKNVGASGNGGAGGACFLTAGSLANNTFVGNVGAGPTGAGSGVYCEGNVEVVNNVIANGVAGVGLYVAAGSSGTKDYNCFWGNEGGAYGGAGVTPGAHDVQADPGFVSGSNFHLTRLSPCVDAGTNMAWMVSAGDLDGHDRIINGHVDIGAYEYAVIDATIKLASDGANLHLSWPAACLGWELQAQTNSLTEGLGTDWFSVSGSTATNELFIPLDPKSPGVFYRLLPGSSLPAKAGTPYH